MAARKQDYLLTIEDPLNKDPPVTHALIKERLCMLPSVLYWCISDEIGNETKLYHTHVYVHMLKGVNFERIKLLFPTAHFDFCKGTQTENKQYVFKEGKWKDTQKEDTRINGTQEEWGEIIEKYTTTKEKLEAEDLEKQFETWIQEIKDGIIITAIIDKYPKALRYIHNLYKYEQIYQSQRYEKIAEEKEKKEKQEKDILTHIYNKVNNLKNED